MKPAEEIARELLCAIYSEEDAGEQYPLVLAHTVAAIEAERREALEEAWQIVDNAAQQAEFIRQHAAVANVRENAVVVRDTLNLVRDAIRALLPAAPKPPGAA